MSPNSVLCRHGSVLLCFEILEVSHMLRWPRVQMNRLALYGYFHELQFDPYSVLNRLLHWICVVLGLGEKCHRSLQHIFHTNHMVLFTNKLSLIADGLPGGRHEVYMSCDLPVPNDWLNAAKTSANELTRAHICQYTNTYRSHLCIWQIDRKPMALIGFGTISTWQKKNEETFWLN